MHPCKMLSPVRVSFDPRSGSATWTTPYPACPRAVIVEEVRPGSPAALHLHFFLIATASPRLQHLSLFFMYDQNAERVAPFFSIALATVPSTLTSLHLQSTDLVFILIPIFPSVIEAIQPALRVFLRAFTHFTIEDRRSVTLGRGLSGYTC